MTVRQPEYNYHNESELYQDLYKSGVYIIIGFYLDPNKHKYTSVFGDFVGMEEGVESFSLKVCKGSLKNKDIKKHFKTYIRRLAEKRNIIVSGNWGYCETDENIYFCGQFSE
ncbi:MAG: hypothetical protein GY774_35695 [Planctomycetes bacterium]|nr:hypothetical protein [Planctomycetota bacterium]